MRAFPSTSSRQFSRASLYLPCHSNRRNLAASWAGGRTILWRVVISGNGFGVAIIGRDTSTYQDTKNKNWRKTMTKTISMLVLVMVLFCGMVLADDGNMGGTGYTQCGGTNPPPNCPPGTIGGYANMGPIGDTDV